MERLEPVLVGEACPTERADQTAFLLEHLDVRG
jgi:hypothetical protein